MGDFAKEPAVLTGLNRMTIQISGSGILEHTFDQSFYREKTNAGSICILPKGIRSGWRLNYSATIFHLYFFPTFFTSLFQDKETFPLEKLEFRHLFNGYDPFLEQIGQRLLYEFQSDEVLSQLYIQSLMYTLLLHLARNYSSVHPPIRIPPRGLSSHHFQQIKNYIQEHLKNDLTLTDMAAVVGLSSSHFSRQFKETTGISPHQYLIRTRVHQADKLLREGRLTIAEVARRVGFADQSHLSRHFQRIFGQTPGTVFNSKNVQKERKNLQDPSE